MHSKSDTLAPVGVIGAGRLGTALVDGLRQAGQPVEGPVRRGEVPRRCRAIVLCVPDAEIPAAAATVAGATPLVGHTSGATPLNALAAATEAGADAFGWHPLQTFSGGDEAPSETGAAEDGPPRKRAGEGFSETGAAEDGPPRERAGAPFGAGAAERGSPFAGAGCAVAGSSPAALAFARELAETLGMTAFELDDQHRAAYHAAASIASNFLVTLQDAAERIAAGAGLEPHEARQLLAPLIRRTVDNHVAHGPERALTGAVARGDEATVALQREAVEHTAPELLPLFDELVVHTRRLAGREALA